MEARTDQEWIRLLKQDDPQAARDLWELLFTYAANLEARYHGLDDPAGLVRDAAVQAYRRIRTRGAHQFRFECPFPAYCRVILAREMLRLVKKQLERQPELAEIRDAEAIPAEETPRLPGPGQLYTLLQPCLDRLTARERDVIEFLYIKEENPQAVADRLTISRNYVNVIACRVRRKLRDCMEERGYRTVDDVRNSGPVLGS